MKKSELFFIISNDMKSGRKFVNGIKPLSVKSSKQELEAALREIIDYWLQLYIVENLNENYDRGWVEYSRENKTFGKMAVSAILENIGIIESKCYDEDEDGYIDFDELMNKVINWYDYTYCEEIFETMVFNYENKGNGKGEMKIFKRK